MMHWLETLKTWTQQGSKRLSESKHAEWLLALISFFESIFFPIPTDVFFAPLVVLRPRSWFRLSLITTVSSLLGGAAAYAIGYGIFNITESSLFSWLDLETSFTQIQILFDRNVFTAMLISAVSFIPFKALAVAGGIFQVNFLLFILGSLVGRTLRFFIEGYLVATFGSHVTQTIYRYWNWFIAGLLVCGVGVVMYTAFR